MNEWERIYLSNRPQMGAPDGTADGHGAAESAARLKVARRVLVEHLDPDRAASESDYADLLEAYADLLAAMTRALL